MKVVLRALRVMNLLESADQLSHVCLNGEYSRRQGQLRVPSGLPRP